MGGHECLLFLWKQCIHRLTIPIKLPRLSKITVMWAVLDVCVLHSFAFCLDKVKTCPFVDSSWVICMGVQHQGSQPCSPNRPVCSDGTAAYSWFPWVIQLTFEKELMEWGKVTLKIPSSSFLPVLVYLLLSTYFTPKVYFFQLSATDLS